MKNCWRYTSVFQRRTCRRGWRRCVSVDGILLAFVARELAFAGCAVGAVEGCDLNAAYLLLREGLDLLEVARRNVNGAGRLALWAIKLGAALQMQA
jgi:hypothetical protein